MKRLEERLTGAAADRGTRCSLPPIDLLAVVVNYQKSTNANTDEFCQLWINDGSLIPEREQACITFWGIQAEALLQTVAVGDVMRFNRVSLKLRRRDQDYSGASGQMTYNFNYAWSDPEAGSQFCRLGHFDSHSGRFVPDDSLSIPSSMLTSVSCLERLSDWYKSTKAFRINEGLAVPPCQCLSLYQFQTSLGVVGHAMAKVRQVEQSEQDFSLRTSKKRRRATKKPNNQRFCFALLTDEIHSLSFVDQQGCFQSVLQQALKKQKPIRLLYVKTKRFRQGSKQGAYNEIVLVPTRDTVIEIISDDQWQTPPSTQAMQAVGSSTQFSSMPDTSGGPKGGKLELFVSPLKDLLVGSKSLMEAERTCATKWHDLLCDRQSVSGYCDSANLLIGTRRFIADGSILKVLCGDQSLDSESWSPLLLQGLLEEQIPLEWSFSGGRIVHVRLLVLP